MLLHRKKEKPKDEKTKRLPKRKTNSQFQAGSSGQGGQMDMLILKKGLNTINESLLVTPSKDQLIEAKGNSST